MAKQQQRTNPASYKAKQRSAVAEALETVKDFELPEFFKNSTIQTLVLFAFACLLYSNTLWHQFVQDDAIVITDNMFTQQGVGGINGILTKDTFFGFFKVEGKDMLVSGGRYRPFTLVLFALLYQFAGPNPFAFHLLTVLLFATTVVVLYRTLLILFAPRGESYAALVAFVSTLLFAAHPIHTEVVANVKGCDEIVTLLGSLGAMWLVFKGLDTGKSLYPVLAVISFFLACMSKENAATFVVIVPLAIYVFRPNADIGKIITSTLPLILGFLVFFIIRGSILHWKFGASAPELMNNPYLKQVGGAWVPFTQAEKLATITYTLGKYVLLLIFPHPLTHDYYPRHVGIMSFASPGALLSLLLYIGMVVYVITGWRKRDPIRFGIAFFLLSLSIVSNIVFPVGTNMGERFAFMPSVGFCLIAGVVLVNLMRSGNGWAPSKLGTVLMVSGVVAALFALKTLTRNPAWETNEKLFFTDVNTSVNSAKIRNACGGVLFDKARVEVDETKRKEYCTQAVAHLDKAVEIYPNYSDAYMSRGGSHLLLGNFDKSVADYRIAEKYSPNNERVQQGLSVALREAGKYYGEKRGDLAQALKMLNEAWSKYPKDAETARLLGVANGMSQNHPEALRWFLKAVELSPDNASYMFDASVAYRMTGDVAKAEEMLQKASAKDPELVKKKMQR